MPGIPTKFVIADLVFDRLRLQDPDAAALLNNPENLKFAYLGAIGASFGDLAPALSELGAAEPNTPFFQAWLLVLQLFAGTPNPSGVPKPGIYPNLKQLRDTLDKLNAIVDGAVGGDPVEKDVEKAALFAMKDELANANLAAKTIISILSGIQNLAPLIGTAIGSGGPRTKVGPSDGWRVRDTLHGSRTGKFLQNLQTLAAGDDSLKAYALGAKVSYAADLCGNPFVNSVVGGPYRNDWWRHRWICNYVDAWVWGFYQIGGSGKVTMRQGVPTPPYTVWPNVCAAKLHERIDFGLDTDALMAAVQNGTPFPAVLPQSFVDFWKQTYELTYGTPATGDVVDDAGIQSAFACTWLILWIQTSGEVIPCMPTDQINFPDDCGAKPDWVAVDGSVLSGGSTAKPPDPAPTDPDPSTAETVSGIVLAIIGALNVLGGYVIGGLEAIVVAAGLIGDAQTDPDWDKLNCYKGWLYVYLYNLSNAMHDLLKQSGFGFPYSMELNHDAIVFSIDGTVSPFDAALNTAQSLPPSPTYPASTWVPFFPNKTPRSNWNRFPTEPLEAAPENAYPANGPTFPFHFVDGFQPAASPPPKGTPAPAPLQVNPVVTTLVTPPLVRDKVTFGAIRANFDIPQATNALFGNAVDVSLELIERTAAEDFLDWDLDGDRGIAYPTWRIGRSFVTLGPVRVPE